MLVHLEAALVLAGMPAPGWLVVDAQRLFASNCLHAWHVDGAPGLVYTLDWGNQPVVRQRLHWVHCEASAAASTLLKRTGEAQYETWYRCFWEYSERYLIDRVHGSWHHELDPFNCPSAEIWGGKPDLYHAWQAVLIPRLPLAPSLASALARASIPAAM
ncbi:putative sugar isomerase YihS [compost metagenome]